MKERNESIDISKAIGILLMILGHCPGIPHLLRNTIFSFHMPLFYIFSGYFYRRKPIKEIALSGFKHLVIPYIITSIVCIFLCLTAKRSDLAQEAVIGTIMSNGGWPPEIIGANLPYIGPIWFLLALFWCKIFYAYLKERTQKVLIVSFIISTISFIIGKYLLNLPFGILTGFCGMIFYAFGDYWQNRLKAPIQFKLLVLGIAIWLFCILRSHLELATFDCKHYPLNMIGAFVGTYITYIISSKTPKMLKPVLIWIGKNTLLILCYHTLTNFLFYNITTYFLVPFNISLSIPLIWIFNFGFGLGLPALHYYFNKIISTYRC